MPEHCNIFTYIYYIYIYKPARPLIKQHRVRIQGSEHQQVVYKTIRNAQIFFLFVYTHPQRLCMTRDFEESCTENV